MRFIAPFTTILSFLTSGRLAFAQGDALVQPETIDSSNGELNTTITLEYADVSGPHYSITNTRLLNGKLPGPTIRLNAGDTLRVLFENKLSYQDDAVNTGFNVLNKPDHSNLHYHGSHVSGELPSDDVRLIVAPGESHQYETVYPSNHMPGTHWIHVHMHGSSALQVGGGAAMAMIVKDPDGYLPTQVEEAADVLLVVQNIDENKMSSIVSKMKDGMMQMTFDQNSPTNFRVVNGQYQPEVSMQPGEWQRWRIVWGHWLRDSLNFKFASGSSCEMQLLAKDGIYLQDYPRAVTVLPIPVGGRADVMVRCSTAGTKTVLDFDDLTLFTVNVSGETVSSTDLESWTPTVPAYLTDLTSTPADEGCACQTQFTGCNSGGGVCVNQKSFNSSYYIHTVAFGSVVERQLRAHWGHPYHQHVYPFQIVDGVAGFSDAYGHATYFQMGDWHDVIRTDRKQTLYVRYRADVHTGVVMLHCHILDHEDEGTMAQEMVVEGGSCACGESKVGRLNPSLHYIFSFLSLAFAYCLF